MRFLRIRHQGVTIFDLLTTLAVGAITLSIAVPSFNQVSQKRGLVGAAERASAIISQAQSEAIKRNAEVTVAFTRAAATRWCVGFSVGDTACDCMLTDASVSGACATDGVLHAVSYLEYAKSRLVSADSDTNSSFTYEPIRGILADTGDSAELVFSDSHDDFQIQVDVGLATGKVRLCNPVSTKQVSGYRAC